MKNFTLVICSIVIIALTTGCQSDKKKPVIETVSIRGDDTVIDGISEAEPDKNIETIEDMTVTNTNGKTTGILLRLPMPSAVTADEVDTAYLRLKYKSGDVPSLKASGITKDWLRTEATWNDIHSSPLLITDHLSEKVEMDYYSIDVTDIVRKWLKGSNENEGFLVTQAKENTSTVFFSPYNCEPDQYPELVITYEKKTMPTVGTYVYKEQENGNCLSFALRDTSPILQEDLGVDLKVIESKYNNSGLDDVLNYIDGLTLDYIAKHKDSLKIDTIRKINRFDSPINEGEYRMALRVGVLELENKFYEYDFHFQVQLTDGSWGEKLGAGTSRIVPGSNIEIDPSLYPWDASTFWDNPKTRGLYDSPTIFYAVKKSTTDYTSHATKP